MRMLFFFVFVTKRIENDYAAQLKYHAIQYGHFWRNRIFTASSTGDNRIHTLHTSSL